MGGKRGRGAEPDEPFRDSGSGADYNAQGNWGAERRLDGPEGGTVRGPEGAPSGAGDGGFGPEGDYESSQSAANADIAGETNADPGALVDQAKTLGTPKPGRATTGEPPDEMTHEGDRR